MVWKKLSRKKVIKNFWINEGDWDYTVLSRIWRKVYFHVLLVRLFIGTMSLKRNLPKYKMCKLFDSVIPLWGIYPTNIFGHNSDTCIQDCFYNAV